MKQPKKKTRQQKKAEHKTPGNYYRARREELRKAAAQKLNQELNAEE